MKQLGLQPTSVDGQQRLIGFDVIYYLRKQFGIGRFQMRLEFSMLESIAETTRKSDLFPSGLNS